MKCSSFARTSLLLASLCLFAAGSLPAATVTFDPLPGPNGDAYTGHTEAGITVTPLSGVWNQAFNVGNPVPSIWLDSATGSLEFTTGGIFTFLSFDMGTGGGSGPSYSIEGYLNNVLVLSDSGSNPDNAFHTIFSLDSLQNLDRLVIAATLGQTTSANIDNIVLGGGSQVPEPGTWVLLAGGLALVLASRKR
jgi:hypothetical protein